MTPANLAGQFGDTTYTKVFVGGLAWETQKETMKKYFEQFGEILEAVVITDKTTGRSKGYGFVRTPSLLILFPPTFFHFPSQFSQDLVPKWKIYNLVFIHFIILGHFS